MPTSTTGPNARWWPPLLSADVAAAASTSGGGTSELAPEAVAAVEVALILSAEAESIIFTVTFFGRKRAKETEKEVALNFKEQKGKRLNC